MKGINVVNFNIGNIAIKLSMQGFSSIMDKAGSSTHSHAEFEYHFVMNGNAVIKFDENLETLSQNSAVLVFPGSFHKFLKSETESNVLSISFSIKKGKYGVDYYKAIERKLTANNYLIFEKNPTVTELIRGIVSTIYSKNLFATEEMRARLTLLFTSIFSKLTEEGSNANNKQLSTQEYDTRVYIIEEYFNEHYMENLSLIDLSSRLYLGEQQTDRMIKKIYGVSFKQRLTKIRIKSAMELLSETDKTIVEISEKVGYESYNGFFTAFKKLTGLTPEKWRILNKK